ncbi:citrate synthase-lysine N-methyltransferase CSKMT, mitochondrial isoform X1 [Sarcophilus harrisii]|uniref:citrate synthase-lysine N-methyltransferase CSKMT, mitochondrial isoform X1 n=1 Tax=Sarcophilus harrisii TaxID=9305 RepID=UPI000C79F903|nr:citrate synthase-lysine N-methyltransferase CSKMT, mitochondrial isoform X1 [Sarcophilus harrisii]
MALLHRLLHKGTRAKRSWAGRALGVGNVGGRGGCPAHAPNVALSQPRAGSLAGSCLSDPGLWDRLHAQALPGRPPNFDWFFGYEEVRGLLLPLLQKGAPRGPAVAPLRVLDVGCGTSDLCPGLYTKCPLPLNVLGVDFSAVAVQRMKRLLEGHGDRPGLRPGHPDSRLHFLQADARDLGPACPSGSFQLVLDKGTWDAVARGGQAGAEQLLSECLRVLAPQGTLVQFSDEDPDVRLPCLERGAGSRLVKIQELGPFKGLTYFAYLVQAAQ